MHGNGPGLSAIYDGLRILHTYPLHNLVCVATTGISEMAMMAAAARWLGMKFLIKEVGELERFGLITYLAFDSWYRIIGSTEYPTR